MLWLTCLRVCRAYVQLDAFLLSCREYTSLSVRKLGQFSPLARLLAPQFNGPLPLLPALVSEAVDPAKAEIPELTHVGSALRATLKATAGLLGCGVASALLPASLCP